MKKRRVIRGLAIVAIVAVIVVAISKLSSNKVTLVINNETINTIDYLKLNYTGLKEDLNIPTIKANESIKYKVQIDKEFREGSMSIYYVDDNNKKVDFVIVGYFEKGYKDTIDVKIKEVDNKIEITAE